ncbi:unnamed protein product [Ascophyllum nodosum]
MVDGTYCSETLNDMPDTAKASTINIDVGATVIVRKGKLEGQKGKVVDKANGWYKVQTFAEDITTSFRASDLGMISSPPSKGSDSCPSPAGSVASSTASAKSASPLLQNASPVMTSSSHRHTSSPSSKRDSKAPRCHEALSGRSIKTRGSTSMLSSTSEASPARGASGTDAGVEMGERERGGDKGTDAGTNEVSDEAATGIEDTRVGEGKDASERQAQERENECLEECQDKEHQQQKDEEEKGQGVLIVRETLDKGNKELMEENAEEENSGERDDVEGEDYTDGEEIQENDQGEGPHDMLERERTERNKRGDGGEALEGVAQCELGQDEGRDDGEDGALERGTSKRTGEGGAGGDFGEKRVEGEAMAIEEQDGKDEEEDEQEEGGVADRKEGEEMTGQEEAQDEPEDDEMTEEEDVDDGHQEDDEMTEQDEEASSEDEDEQEEEEEDEDEDEVDLEAMIKLAASAARGHASSTPASASGGGSAVRKQPSGEGGPARARKRPCGAIRSLDSGLSNPKGLLDTGSRKGETLSASAHGKVAKLYARSALYTGQGRAMSLEKTKTPKDETAGKGWFHMEQAEMTPELKRDLDVIRMRNFVDPKRFYKSSDKASKFMQVGTVKESAAEFFSSRLTKKERKKTLVDELLVADETFRAYAKNQYKSIQTKKKAGGKAQYKDLMRKRKGGLKWKP